MTITIGNSKQETGRKAAEAGAQLIRRALAVRGRATIVLATGASQFEMLESLVGQPNVDWTSVTAFHLDEYLGLSAEHPASFRRYLAERFVKPLPKPVEAFHFIDPGADPEKECSRLAGLIAEHTVDVTFAGIGENGHLAFNDPPADFHTREPFRLVHLDEICRRQQFREGWFEEIEDVPKRAISMSIHQIMASRNIICTVPDRRKAVAVRDSVKRPISPMVPASILQRHPACQLFLDQPAASLL